MKNNALWPDRRSEPFSTITNWLETRSLWLLIGFVCLAMVFLAHAVLQVWLYMKPCEQCVYIRFAFLCVSFGAIIVAIHPTKTLCKVVGCGFSFWGTACGIYHSVLLNKIHLAVRSENPFGVQGCSFEPSFPFGLPLEKWSPDWFLPTGDCGFDYPVIPEHVTLTGVQQWLTGLYTDGWYLWPPAHLINMAQACLIIFGLLLLLIVAAALFWMRQMFTHKLYRERKPQLSNLQEKRPPNSTTSSHGRCCTMEQSIF